MLKHTYTKKDIKICKKYTYFTEYDYGIVLCDYNLQWL